VSFSREKDEKVPNLKVKGRSREAKDYFDFPSSSTEKKGEYLLILLSGGEGHLAYPAKEGGNFSLTTFPQGKRT